MGHYRLWRQIKRLRHEIQRLRFMVSRPHSIHLVVIGEQDMAIKFEVALEDPTLKTPADWAEIASGELVVTIGDQAPIALTTTKVMQETPPRQVVDDRFVGPQGTFVRMDFNYVDDAGNRSAVITATQELLDTVPPVAPGSIGLVITGEVPD